MRRVVLIHSDGAYPMGLVESFGGKAARVGIEIERDVTFSAEAEVPTDLIARADLGTVATNTDAFVIFSNTSDGAALVKQLRGEYSQVKLVKPKASRPRSREVYLYAKK